jgi:hypothetical protein
MAPPEVDLSHVMDVVVIPARSDDDDDQLDREPPAGWTNGPITLMDDLRIEWIEDSPSYMDACDPAGLNFKSTRQFGQRYAFVRQPAPTQPSLFHVDADGRIALALQLSRYVILNSHCTEVAARRLTNYFPGPDQIAPLRNEYRFYAFHALKDGARDWLTDEDARSLGARLRRFASEREQFPERVLRAMTRCEESFRTPFTETAAVGVVTALEVCLRRSVVMPPDSSEFACRQWHESSASLGSPSGALSASTTSVLAASTARPHSSGQEVARTRKSARSRSC